MTRQIVAYSGMRQRDTDTRTGFDLVRYACDVSRRPDAPRLVYVPTAVGDDHRTIDAVRSAVAQRLPHVQWSTLTLFPQPNVPDVGAHLLGADVVLVEGGSVVNLLALWRAHGVDKAMRAAWEDGVVLAGGSAGSLCWHVGGPTDSFGDSLAPVTDALAFLPYSNGVHDDLDDQPRRTRYREWVADGTLPAGYATQDGTALHYVGTQLHEAVTVRAGATAWRVEPDGRGGWREEALPTRFV